MAGTQAGTEWTGKKRYWLEGGENVMRVELRGPQQQETEGKLQFHAHLTGCMFTSLKAYNLKVPMSGTCCIVIRYDC